MLAEARGCSKGAAEPVGIAFLCRLEITMQEWEKMEKRGLRKIKARGNRREKW